MPDNVIVILKRTAVHVNYQRNNYCPTMSNLFALRGGERKELVDMIKSNHSKGHN